MQCATFNHAMRQVWRMRHRLATPVLNIYFVLQPQFHTGEGVEPRHPGSLRVASPDDVNMAMRQQLLVLVDWAKHIPAFSKLNMEDQVSKRIRNSLCHLEHRMPIFNLLHMN